MSEYTDEDMVKSLVKIIESLTNENKELRKEIKDIKAIPFMRYTAQDLGLPSVIDKERG